MQVSSAIPEKPDVHEDKGVSRGALSFGTFFERTKKVPYF